MDTFHDEIVLAAYLGGLIPTSVLDIVFKNIFLEAEGSHIPDFFNNARVRTGLCSRI